MRTIVIIVATDETIDQRGLVPVSPRARAFERDRPRGKESFGAPISGDVPDSRFYSREAADEDRIRRVVESLVGPR